MWIVKLALARSYTFIVLALLILLISPLVILRTPTDIFPNIDIPVLASIWSYTGMNAEEMEGRITSNVERSMTTVVSNIEHTESVTLNGRAIIKTFLQPGASVDAANAQITAISQALTHGLPPGTSPPFIMTCSASSVPIVQLAISSDTLSEAQLNDYAQNFIRPDLVTIPGAEMPYPYGGKQRQVNVSLSTALLQAKGLSPSDVVTAIAYVSVHLKFSGSSATALTIPVTTVLFRSEGIRAAVVRNGRAELVPITIGRDFGDTLEVLAGLRPQESLIVNPPDSLISGTPVKIEEPLAK